MRMSATTSPEPIASTSSGSGRPNDEGQVKLKGFLAGTASGLTKLVVGHPFDTVKLRMQCSVSLASIEKYAFYSWLR